MDNNLFAEILYRINCHSEIDYNLLFEGFKHLILNMKGSLRDIQLGALLNGLVSRGPIVEEICALVDAIFSIEGVSPFEESKTDIKLPNGEKLIGAVGSGKKGFKTINITTPALLVASASGIYTVKPGSSSTSSLTGSSDFIELMGVNLNLKTEEMVNILRQTKFGFFQIEKQIPKFDKIYNKRFIAPHALSYVLPGLLSPIKLDGLIYGLSLNNLRISANLFSHYGFKNLFIVSTTFDGIHYIDEMGINGITKMLGIKDGRMGLVKRFDPLKELCLPNYDINAIKQKETKIENVKIVVKALSQDAKGPITDIISINAATALFLAKKCSNIKEGFEIARSTIQNGEVITLITDFIEITKGDLTKFKKLI